MLPVLFLYNNLVRLDVIYLAEVAIRGGNFSILTFFKSSSVTRYIDYAVLSFAISYYCSF
jgi:hypothetical protein